ncbi:MAG: ACP S-malonyltransferase [Chloroflexi bacterium]|jgi:[acyl-carrier-protein] S-malonyltransferase|nr:ACP S-malonyltransferase [Chloroflexota bacterium]
MRTAVLFPGQGSQEVGMGQAAYESSSAAKAVFDEADSLLDFPLSELAFTGPEEALTDTVNQQPALLTASIANWRIMLETNWPHPDFLAGHSLGEFSALVAAGSITFADGLALVRKRGELMKAAGEKAAGGMAAILALDANTIRGVCLRASSSTGHPVQLANDNCPGQIVISGHERALQQAMNLAKEAGARKVVRLPITIAAHSGLMASVANEFAEAVDATDIRRPTIPVVGNVSAVPMCLGDDIRLEIKSQLTSPVAWTSSMRYLLGQDVKRFIETGPGNVLLGLMKRIDRKSKRIKFELDKVPTDL